MANLDLSGIEDKYKKEAEYSHKNYGDGKKLESNEEKIGHKIRTLTEYVSQYVNGFEKNVPNRVVYWKTKGMLQSKFGLSPGTSSKIMGKVDGIQRLFSG